MSSIQMLNVTEAVLNSMTEEEFANWQIEQGKQVIYHQGCYWHQSITGFYEPLHWLARLSAEQATCPVSFSWGFRAALYNKNATAANGSIPVHLLSNLQNYGLHILSANRRKHLRQCQKKVNIFQLTCPNLLQEQGYEVVLSAAKRTEYLQAPSKTEYLTRLTNYIDTKRRLILVGLIGDKLGGYISGYAVSGTAYFEHLYISTEAITTNINLGLIFEFVQACQRSDTIHELVNGLHSPEDEKLCIFKDGIGFSVEHIPARVQINPIIAQVIRWRYPHKYYRLTGRKERK
ncbi:hypothetical protein QUB80_31720 [Chlorogloeopsis sp. ULAP01]|uniref:hypothetical protein n=1 Tax=Chlorogloeopsis sp. ULAP01 TaxID=3056483 RepID=UPI0025AB103C|nr:hypothetical protein [Chlorogloeopsis sp. ULAP01]MDM9385224.1 hypothetical protein [Chlorogloeopsis sp. ULAP01]